MPPTRRTKSTSKSTSKPISKDNNPDDPLALPTLRTTTTHIFFHGGLLSNWHPSQPPFDGAVALAHCLPQLVALDIDHPPPTAVWTRLLGRCRFNRGEQWMMAMKAWLFEGELEPELSSACLSDGDIDALKRVILSPSPPEPEPEPELESGSGPISGSDTGPKSKGYKPLSTISTRLYTSTLSKILRSNIPRQQKSLGRQVTGFDETVWRTACMPVVTAGCVARAEADPALKRVYLAAGGRTFVEGSPRDKIWGVGLKWDGAAIEDEANWRGENRLGECHSRAADIIRRD